jgi:hypothetical protein
MVASHYLDFQGDIFSGKYNGLKMNAYTIPVLGTGYLAGPSEIDGAWRSGADQYFSAQDWLGFSDEKKKKSFLMPSLGELDSPGESSASLPSHLYWWTVPSPLYSEEEVESYLADPSQWTENHPSIFYSNSRFFSVPTGLQVGNSLKLSQSADDVVFLTNKATPKTRNLRGSGTTIVNGNVQSQSVNMVKISVPDDGVALTDQLTFRATTAASTASATTKGISHTTSRTVGASFKAAMGLIPGADLGVNASVEHGTTVNTSTTGTQTSSIDLTQSNAISVTVQPGQSIVAEQTYLRQTTSIPFQAPVQITGDVSAAVNPSKHITGYFGGAISAEKALNAAKNYGYFPSSLIDREASGSGAVTVLAEGEITNVNVGMFEATDYKAKSSVVVYSSPVHASKVINGSDAGHASDDPVLSREQVAAKRKDFADLPIATVNDVERRVGLYYSPHQVADLGGDLAGGDLADLIYMSSPGQTAYSFGGNDRVYGSVHRDHIYLGDGHDDVKAFAGNDLIVSYGGAHSIDSGDGDDRLALFLGSHDAAMGVHSLRLGQGADQVELNKESGQITSMVVEIEDFSVDDRIDFHGFDSITGEIDAGSLYLKEGDQFFAKITGFTGSLPESVGRDQLIEHALLNAKSYGFKPFAGHSTATVMNQMATDQILAGVNPVTSYSSLKNSKSALSGALKVIAESLDMSSKSLISEGLSSRKDFDTMRDLVDHLLSQDHGGLSQSSKISELVNWS